LAASASIAIGPRLSTAATDAGPQQRFVKVAWKDSKKDGVLKFLGVPFAHPPVGALRWAAPQPMPAWSGVRPAKMFGPAAMQAAVPESYRTSMSEDCLYLNVWTSSVSRNARQPVMVWIYGGGNLTGSPSERFTDGSNLAKLGVTVVAANYRLGAFGYLNDETLGANFGVLDQNPALRWVQENIEAFGGNPSRVLGVRAILPARSTFATLLQSPLAKDCSVVAPSRARWRRPGRYRNLQLCALARRHREIVRSFGAPRTSMHWRAIPADRIVTAARPLSGTSINGPRTPFEFGVDARARRQGGDGQQLPILERGHSGHLCVLPKRPRTSESSQRA